MVEESLPSRLGMTVSKRFGNSVLRNVFKRRVREVFRQEHSQLDQRISLNIFPKDPGLVPTYLQVMTDFRLLFDEIQRLYCHA